MDNGGGGSGTNDSCTIDDNKRDIVIVNDSG